MRDRDVAVLVVTRRMAADGEGRQLRLAARLSLAEVAAAVDVDTSTIWRWEQGRRRPRGEAALRYGHFLRALQGPGRDRSAAS